MLPIAVFGQVGHVRMNLVEDETGRRKRVLVTRAAAGGSALAEHLRALGLEPLLVPAIEVAAPSSFEPLDEALRQLTSFQWLLFTSATAAEAFAQRWGSGTERSLPPYLRVAAIGPATARALETLGFAVDLVPAQAVAESLTEALLPYTRLSNGTATRFLLIRAQEARELLPETLRAAGAEVTVAAAYRTVLPQGSVDVLRHLFADPLRAPHAITFTSSSTARNLYALCEAAGVYLPEGAVRVSIGPITSQTLREMNLPPHAEAREANVVSLAEEVADVLQGTRA